MKTDGPSEAIIAVTLNCNARCVMCNIWQNKIQNEVKPQFYRKLPSTLKEINITGGEPFLRNDLPEIIKIIKKTCPKVRLLINTNGYLVQQIKKLLPQIVNIDPHIAFRVSLDGWGKKHNTIRRLPHFFSHALESLQFGKQVGIKDVGISFTLMEQNKTDLLKIYTYCKKNSFDFSLTVATDSPIYFGSQKQNLRPKENKQLHHIQHQFLYQQRLSLSPKAHVRAWFNKHLFLYMKTHKRFFSCMAGRDFFYLDSLGRIYVCHIKPWMIGDLKKKSFNAIFHSKKARLWKQKASPCNDCWMICTVRNTIKKQWLSVGKEVLSDFFTKYE